MNIDPLTSADRCDRCGARAVTAMRARGEAESHLLFCGHHTEKYRETIKVSAQVIWDARGSVVLDRTPIRL